LAPSYFLVSGHVRQQRSPRSSAPAGYSGEIQLKAYKTILACGMSSENRTDECRADLIQPVIFQENIKIFKPTLFLTSNPL